ncbi:MAG: hypothetical protein KBC41_00965 [Candidatus Pacebacteria bacterium]|nr:hypothetical protein [Candidatus Paceibacterota bacterium]MBP9866634.1 hypothetical protein [Candidatus Paceibacterota bacterium]
MGSSIQDYLKKINSKLTWLDCVSLLVTMLFIMICVVFLIIKKKSSNIPVSYIVGKPLVSTVVDAQDIRPFGSKHGTTYTFYWCKKQEMIREYNKIYFNNEEEAKKTGRTLSKFCQK